MNQSCFMDVKHGQGAREVQRRLEADEMRVLRRVLKITLGGEGITKEAREEKRAITKFRKRQSRFIGRVKRAGGLECLITGMIEGEKRQRQAKREDNR